MHDGMAFYINKRKIVAIYMLVTFLVIFYGAALYLLIAYCVHDSPCTPENPALHMHSVFSYKSSWNFPGSHERHKSMEAAPGTKLYLPCGQSMHALSGCVPYVPEGHSEHVDPNPSLNVPAAHGKHSPPSGPWYPALHWQSSRFVLFAVFVFEF